MKCLLVLLNFKLKCLIDLLEDRSLWDLFYLILNNSGFIDAEIYEK